MNKQTIKRKLAAIEQGRRLNGGKLSEEQTDERARLESLLDEDARRRHPPIKTPPHFLEKNEEWQGQPCRKGKEHMGPNEQDNPELDQELKVGDIVYLTITHDERDRPIPPESRTPLRIVRVGTSRTSFDYEVESPSGNRFFVTVDEVEAEVCQI